MTLTDRELATVLFALRHAQLLVESPSDREGLREQGHFTDLEPLSVAEIDDLCDRLNAKEVMMVYVLFHETNTGHGDESDGYVEEVYATEAEAEAAKLTAIRAAIKEGKAVWWNPDTEEEDADWDHDWHVEAHEVIDAAAAVPEGEEAH